MPGTCQDAANAATNLALNRASPEWLKLTSMMCWDAVIRIALLAGIIDEIAYKRCLAAQIPARTDLLAPYDRQTFLDLGLLVNLPAGHAIVFYEIEKHTLKFDRRGALTSSTMGGGHHPIHAMISVGLGMAAGNKNSCLGIGNKAGVSWEVLDLANGLEWKVADIIQGNRTVRACHRPITEIR